MAAHLEGPPAPYIDRPEFWIRPRTFGRERVKRVINRAQAALTGAPLLPQVSEALQPFAGLSRIFVREGNRIVPIALSSIERVQGADDYATIVTQTKQYLVKFGEHSFIRFGRAT